MTHEEKNKNGYKLHAKQDGIWLEFENNKGRAMININMTRSEDSIIKKVLMEWWETNFKKPEPKVIPWTIKDAEIFLEKTLNQKGTLEAYRVTSCNLSGLFMKKIKADEYESIFFLYETVLVDFMDNGNPCGKVVEE